MLTRLTRKTTQRSVRRDAFGRIWKPGQGAFWADCVEKLRNQSVADFLRKPMKRNSRKALTTRQRMAARERM
ncbi:MAG: hypothetical protein GKR99_11710 [Rhodobacteraceae bacterium]|nr:hypothetical protein [Paracoccaceae bacterium]